MTNSYLNANKSKRFIYLPNKQIYAGAFDLKPTHSESLFILLNLFPSALHCSSLGIGTVQKPPEVFPNKYQVSALTAVGKARAASSGKRKRFN